MLKEQTAKWNKVYMESDRMAYPAEYVIRIFRGNYPRLNLSTWGGIAGRVFLT